MRIVTTSVSRVTDAVVVRMGEEGNVPFSFCTQSIATASPEVTMRKPTMGLASVCVGMVTRVQEPVTVTAVQVEPLSIVMLTVPDPVMRLM